jgi:cysteine desulfurase
MCHYFYMNFIQRFFKYEERPRTFREGDSLAGARVYLDHAAATPTFTEVREVMLPYLGNMWGNASAIHTEGRMMREVVEDARGKVAGILGVQSTGIIFTSGGTEGNNLAIRGVVEACRRVGKDYKDMEIVTTEIEHPATTNTLRYLESRGVVIQTVPVDGSGRIVLDELKKKVNNQTILVAISYINSEIGTIERVGHVKRVIQEKNKHTLLYVDAAQAPLWVPCELSRLKADIMTFDGGKCGGPQGIGILAMVKHINLAPYTFGGGQERGCRAGTEPVAQIVGMAKALEIAQRDHLARSESIASIRNEAINKIQSLVPGVLVNGATDDVRVANNINISIPGLDSEYAVVILDTHGVAVSTKSACSSAGGGQSAVVLAISGDISRASSTLRITLGPSTTLSDIEYFILKLTTEVMPLAVNTINFD